MISEATLQIVRQRSDLQAIIGETVKLVRRGRSWTGLCPFHKEKSPSFHVSPERGMYHCFGCGEHGNVFSFVMKVEGLSFPEAVRSLAERAGVEIEETVNDQQRTEEQKARKLRDDLHAVNHLAAHFYETALREHPQAAVATDELARRGLVPAEPTDKIATALQAFRVGYAPAAWDALTTYLKQQGVALGLAEQAGLLIARAGGGGHYDRFRNRLMFAVLDLQGRVVSFSGRILPDPQTGQVDKETGKYINGPETLIYKKGETVFGLYQARQSIRQLDETVVVEGNFDVVSLHARGVTNVVAPLGTAFTFEQASQLKRFAPAVTLLFDGDAAGKKAAKSAREPCRRAGLVAKVAVLPAGKDPDELCKEKGPEAILAVVKAARGMLEHLISAAFDAGYVRADAQEKAARAREVVELLAAEEDPNVRALAERYAQEAAGQLLVRDDHMGMADKATFRTLAMNVESAVLRGGQRAPTKGALDPFRHQRNAELVVGALLDFPALLQEPEVIAALDYLDGDAVFVVAALRQVGGDGNLGLDADEFLAKVPPSFHDFALNRLAAPVNQDIQTARMELLSTAAKLNMRSLSRENAIEIQDSARATSAGDDEGAMAALAAIQARAQLKLKRGRT